MRISSMMVLSCLLLPSLGFAQTVLQEQISAVEHAESKHDAAERARVAKELEARRQQQAKLDAERARLRARDESYADALRQAQIDDIHLDLEAKKAVVKRTDAFIDQELKAHAAQTDAVQSTADATRNLAGGVSEKLKSQGRAEEKKSKGFWDF